MGRAPLRCADLVVGYGDQALLPPINLELKAGEFLAVIGRNGSGKTTFIRTALGIIPPLRGSATRPTHSRLSYLPQRAAFDELYPVHCRDVVAMGIERGWSFIRPRPKEVDSRIDRALEEMEINELSHTPFRQLSEGQKQRVLFARLIASEAELAFLDEPTSAMDEVAEREAYSYLARLQHHHKTTIVVVSHYLGVAREFSDRVLLLDRDTPDVVLGEPDDVFHSKSFAARYSDRPPPTSVGSSQTEDR